MRPRYIPLTEYVICAPDSDSHDFLCDLIIIANIIIIKQYDNYNDDNNN